MDYKQELLKLLDKIIWETTSSDILKLRIYAKEKIEEIKKEPGN